LMGPSWADALDREIRLLAATAALAIAVLLRNSRRVRPFLFDTLSPPIGVVKNPKMRVEGISSSGLE
jgi:hypothetical protein